MSPAPRWTLLVLGGLFLAMLMAAKAAGVAPASLSGIGLSRDGPALLPAVAAGVVLAAIIWAGSRPVQLGALMVAGLLGAAPMIHPGRVAGLLPAACLVTLLALDRLRRHSPALLAEARMQGAGPWRLAVRIAWIAAPGVLLGVALALVGENILPDGYKLALAALPLALVPNPPPRRAPAS